MENTTHAADVLASGIHDAKNRLLEIGTHALSDHPESDRIQTLVMEVAFRLDRTLTAYRLLSQQRIAAVQPVFVPALVQDVLVRCPCPSGLALSSEVAFQGEWLLSRDLVEETLINALQNAARYARTRIALRAFERAGMLVIEVNDDGAGFQSGAETGRGIGLFIAQRVAQLHRFETRDGLVRQGRLTLANGGPLGGALFELELP
jgi:signal transduction histidine kinase